MSTTAGPSLAEFALLVTPHLPEPDLPSVASVDLAPGVRFGPPPAWLATAVHDEFRGHVTNVELGIVDRARWAVTFDLRAGTPATPEYERLGATFEPPYDRIGWIEFAMWLAQPSRAAFLLSVHYERFDTPDGGLHSAYFDAQARREYLRALDSYNARRLTVDDLGRTAALLRVLETVTPNSAVAIAIRALATALRESTFELRYVLLWIALEALFGPRDPVEATYRLRLAIGLFLGPTRDEARALFREVGTAYRLRSGIVHGRTAESYDEVVRRLPTVESWVRDALLNLLEGGPLEAFSDPESRSTYLEALAFSGLPMAADNGSNDASAE